MLLSILIPSLPRRVSFLNRLLAILAPQVTPRVEILVEMEDRNVSIGLKRNSLLAKASGDYITFIDDDDTVTDDYVHQILKGIDQNVDVVCVTRIFTHNGERPAIMSGIPYQRWHTRIIGTQLHYIRGFQHTDAIRRSIVQGIKFEDRKFGEDHLWQNAVEQSKLIKNWHVIEKPTYHYEYRQNKDV